MTESITRIRGTGLPGPSPFGIMLPLLQIQLSSLLSSSQPPTLDPFRFSIFLRLFHPRDAPPSLADLPSTFFELIYVYIHARVYTYVDIRTHIPTLVPLFSPIVGLCRAPSATSSPSSGRTSSQDPVDVNVRLIM